MNNSQSNLESAKELEKRVKELEKRIREMPIYVPYPVPVNPYWDPPRTNQWHPNPTTIWCHGPGGGTMI